jgi:hypothetical protein
MSSLSGLSGSRISFRDEGIAMERRGELASADRLQTLCVTA